MLRKAAFALLVTLSLSIPAVAQTTQATQAKVNIIIDRESVRFAPQELAQELRLVVTDQAGAELYDSGPLSVSTLDWLMRDSKGETVKGGLYLYALTIKDLAGETSQRRGYLIVNRAGDADRVYVATGDKASIGTGKDVSTVTVVSSPEVTIGRAELPANVPQRADIGERGKLPERAADETQASKPTTKLSLAGTLNRIAKFDSNGNLVDSAIFDQNNTVSVGGTTSYGALTLIGNVPSGDAPAMALYNQGGGGGASVAIDFYNTFANGNIPQAKIKAVDDGAFADHLTFWTKQTNSPSFPNGPNNPIFERLRITSTGNVGIGTTNPDAKLSITATGDGARVLHLGTERAWVFKQLGTGAGTALELTGADPSNNNKHFVINTDGSVGIGTGTTAPTGKLKVVQTAADSFAGNFSTSGVATGQSYGLAVSAGTSSGDVALSVRNQAGQHLFAVAGNGLVQFQLPYSGGAFELCYFNVDAGTNSYKALTSCSSSLRYKTGIRPFLGGLDIINRLRPISFTWKQNGTKDIGLGAEEVETVAPLLTFRNDEGEIEGVKYNQLSAVFINAIKEQQAQLQQQQKLIKQLQARLKRVEHRTQQKGRQK